MSAGRTGIAMMQNAAASSAGVFLRSLRNFDWPDTDSTYINHSLEQAPMNLIFRLLLVVFRARFRKPLGPLDRSVITLHVLPTDLDLNMHMNNGRYLTIMDIGRVDLMARVGLLRLARQHGWFPVVGTATIDYRRSLNLFEKYDLETRVIGWDERWFFMEQIFRRNGKIAAQATLKAMIRSQDGLVPTAKVVEAINYDGGKPAIAPDVAARLGLSAMSGDSRREFDDQSAGQGR
jgi:acyl-CoA thioesterase FadM